MITAEPFVYGRTRTVDYRWLQKPSLPLRIGFFADALESCSPKLRKGQKAYFVALDDGGCVLAVMLSLKEAEDQRGRTISFVLGYTVGARAARDFSYHLPALLESCNRTVARYLGSVIQCVESDGQVTIDPFDSLSPDGFGADTISRAYANVDLYSEKPFSGIWSGFNLNSAYSSEQPISGALQARGQEIDGWLSKTADTIRSSVSTPKVVSNFDVSGLGSVFEIREEASNLFSAAGITLDQISPQAKRGLEAREDSETLEQMRRFVGKSESPTPNSIDGDAVRAYGAGSSDDSSQRTTRTDQKTKPSSSAKPRFFDRFLGKSGTLGDDSTEE